MEERCVCCGAIIPEGRQVCPQCEEKGHPKGCPKGCPFYIKKRKVKNLKIAWSKLLSKVGIKHESKQKNEREV